MAQAVAESVGGALVAIGRARHALREGAGGGELLEGWPLDMDGGGGPARARPGSEGRLWVEDQGRVIDKKLAEIHQTGMQAVYWCDMFVLPRTLADKYGPEINDTNGHWSFDSALMINITEYMIDAVFERFPQWS